MKRLKVTLIILFIVAFVQQFQAKVNERIPAIINIPEYMQSVLSPHWKYNNEITKEGIALGKKLFYDKGLSVNGSMHCGSCHFQSKAFSDFRQFSIGFKDAVGVKNAPSLVNLAFQSDFFWDGRSKSLMDQAHDPITNPIEMANSWVNVIRYLAANNEYTHEFKQVFPHQDLDSSLVMNAIAQFQASIVSFSSRYDSFQYLNRQHVFTQEEQLGYQIFIGKGNCNSCHSGPLFSNFTFQNNGLDKVADSGRAKVTKSVKDIGTFKVPSLRNVGLTAPYMHDGRFERLEDVIDFYNHDINLQSKNIAPKMRRIKRNMKLSPQEKKCLILFLRSLNDYDLIKNEAYKSE